MDQGWGEQSGRLETPQEAAGVSRRDMTVALEQLVAVGMEEARGMGNTGRAEAINCAEDGAGGGQRGTLAKGVLSGSGCRMTPLAEIGVAGGPKKLKLKTIPLPSRSSFPKMGIINPLCVREGGGSIYRRVTAGETKVHGGQKMPLSSDSNRH